MRREIVTVDVHAPRWCSALEEHQRALSSFTEVCERFPSEQWHHAPSPGKWSAAEVAIHVCRAYELGRDAAAGAAGMRLLVTPRRAWALRNVLLPVLIWTRRFPHGVPAPQEVLPDVVASKQLSLAESVVRLERAAHQAADGLRSAAEQRPTLRVMHAYFGALTPLAALRLLSAHTRHHARALARQLAPSRRR
jgi:DinB superfamily